MTDQTWDLRDKDCEVCVPSVEASREEMLVAVEASNTKQPGSAPHYAVSEDGERIESDRTMDEAFVDEAIRRAGGELA